MNSKTLVWVFDTKQPNWVKTVQEGTDINEIRETAEKFFENLHLDSFQLINLVHICLEQRNSHWRVQNFVGQPPTTKNGSGPGSAFPGRFDETSVGVPMTMQPVQPIPIEPDHITDAPGRPIDLHTEHPNRAMRMPLPIPVSMGNDATFLHDPPPSDAQPTECPTTSDGLNLHDELAIEGGTISVSSLYSEGYISFP